MTTYLNWTPIKIDRKTMREMFNSSEYEARALSGELKRITKKSNHRHPPSIDLPYCTHTQILEYVDSDNNILAEAHQFLLPNGAVGASGIPDPKKIYDYNQHVIYRLRKE